MTQLTTYTVKSKAHGFVWLFKYHLNGAFCSFEILEGELSNNQIMWLFAGSNFPAHETIMKTMWLGKQLKSNFEIVQADPVLDFENLWELYGLKVKKEASEKAFNKLSPGDKIKCFLAIKKYFGFLQQSGQAKAHLVTWINQKRFNDEY